MHATTTVLPLELSCWTLARANLVHTDRCLFWCRDAVLDIVLQIAEALSLSDEFATRLASNKKLFSLACQVIRLSHKDEVTGYSSLLCFLVLSCWNSDGGLIICSWSRLLIHCNIYFWCRLGHQESLGQFWLQICSRRKTALLGTFYKVIRPLW